MLWAWVIASGTYSQRTSHQPSSMGSNTAENPNLCIGIILLSRRRRQEEARKWPWRVPADDTTLPIPSSKGIPTRLGPGFVRLVSHEIESWHVADLNGVVKVSLPTSGIGPGWVGDTFRLTRKCLHACRRYQLTLAVDHALACRDLPESRRRFLETVGVAVGRVGKDRVDPGPDAPLLGASLAESSRIRSRCVCLVAK